MTHKCLLSNKSNNVFNKTKIILKWRVTTFHSSVCQSKFWNPLYLWVYMCWYGIELNTDMTTFCFLCNLTNNKCHLNSKSNFISNDYLLLLYVIITKCDKFANVFTFHTNQWRYISLDPEWYFGRMKNRWF